MVKSRGNLIGAWAFLVGVIIAIVLGFVSIPGQGIVTALVVIGFIIGLFNIADKESSQFLMSGAVLIIIVSLTGNAFSSMPVLAKILAALMMIFVPATIVVAIKNVFSLAKN